jgi:ketosteroid isomerase-like protein
MAVIAAPMTPARSSRRQHRCASQYSAAMSDENLQVGRDLIDAVNRGDLDAFLARVRPDVVWDDREGWPGIKGVYRGPDGVRDWWDRFLEVWESVAIEIEEIREGPDGRVFLQVSGAFRGGASGASAEVRAWEVLSLEDGQVARRKLLWTREEALDAAGLRDN